MFVREPLVHHSQCQELIDNVVLVFCVLVLLGFFCTFRLIQREKSTAVTRLCSLRYNSNCLVLYLFTTKQTSDDKTSDIHEDS